MTHTRKKVDASDSIVFDAAHCPQVKSSWFDPGHWERLGRLHGRGGGRGAASFVDTPCGPCVLRHFHRGGMIARLLGDRYLWLGRERSRSVAEFRLLQHMHRLGLPVPQALAARVRKHGRFYTADLLTRTIAGARTLDAQLRETPAGHALMQRVGSLIARFHRHGVWHADLNATNILVAGDDLYLIDFDRGRLRRPTSAWRQGNLRRLRRSLVKLGFADDDAEAFEQHLWQPLMQGYAAALEETSST